MTKRIYYSAEFEGVELTKSFKDWAIFLSDKPVAEHISAGVMRNRYNRQKNGESKFNNLQVVGIKPIGMKCSGAGKSQQPVVDKRERPMYELRGGFNRRALV